jgi:hypothetical protein
VGRFPQPVGNANTIHFWLLPYIEQDNLYKSAAVVVGGVSTYDPANVPNGAAAGLAAVKTYLCPSDPSIGANGVGDGSQAGISGGIAAATSYAANGQVFAKNFDPNTFLPGSGEGSPRIPSTFQDGTSNTILFAEKFGRCGANNCGSVWYRNNFSSTYGPYFNVRLAGPTFSFQVKPLPYADPNKCEYRLASTGHTGGIQVCLGDGSCRNGASGVSSTTWWWACTPAGGEVLGSNW